VLDIFPQGRIVPRQWLDRLQQEAHSRQCQEVLAEAPDHQQLPTGLLFRQVQKLAQRHTQLARERQQARRMFDGIDPEEEPAAGGGDAPLQPGAHTLWRFGVGQSIVGHDHGWEGCLREKEAVAQARAGSDEAMARYAAVIQGRHEAMSRDEMRKMHLYDSRKALLLRAEAAGLLAPV